MDGTNRKVLINRDIVLPNGLTVDIMEAKLYWCDAYEGRIEMANYDGSERVLLAQFRKTHVCGISTSSGKILTVNKI